jgi:hypothetical protein
MYFPALGYSHHLALILSIVVVYKSIVLGVDWVDLAQDRDHLRALVNTVMNLRVP